MRSVLITSSILIPVIAALRPILRGRSSPMAQYALWLIVAVRLLVPWEAAPSAYSALALLERAEEPARLAETIGQTAVPLPGMGMTVCPMACARWAGCSTRSSRARAL